ncbi:MAG: hypothetical protein HYY62_08100 [Deltaproteobacteria bacterium]|nr:hypothetical protein [Deltaproteobacteria bacterium]
MKPKDILEAFLKIINKIIRKISRKKSEPNPPRPAEDHPIHPWREAVIEYKSAKKNIQLMKKFDTYYVQLKGTK